MMGDFEGKTRSDAFEQLDIYQDQTFSLLKHTDIDRSHLWTPYGGRFEQQYELFDDLEDQHVSLAKRMNYQGKSAIIDNYGEEITADILNGTIIDTNGKYPDISLSDGRHTVFVECKSGRLHSGVNTANKHS